MKFSWKVFFSTVITIIITFCIGGYLLISSLFQFAYDREIVTAKDENQMLQFAFATAWSVMPISYQNATDDMIEQIALSIKNNTIGENTKIRISNEKQEVIYDNTKLSIQGDLLKHIQKENRGYTVLKIENEYYTQTACILNMDEKQIYLESFRNITAIFVQREEQYRIYEKLIVGLIVVNGLFSYILSIWLTYPIKKLSKVTRQIANGNLGYRAKNKRRDEIGRLAEDFNLMADHLENKICELEAAAKRQDDFIGSFAHELKTPLTSIIGYADMLRSSKMSEEMSFISANYIFKEGKRLESLSLKLLDLIVLQQKELQKKRYSAVKLLEEVEGISLPIVKNRNITMNVEAEEENLFIEEDLMKTVLLNLIDNAKKGIEKSGTIFLKGKKVETGYCIMVVDNGKGIPEEEVAHITEAFYMVDKSRAREKGGVGLGLSICERIMHLHQGTMKIESKLGEGTTIFLYLGGDIEERRQA